MNNAIPVIEVFGPTIQGEGAIIGRKTVFVRTAGCDYRCSWCDSSFTWDATEKPMLLEAAKLWDMICEISNGKSYFDHVTISGGNPVLIGSPMEELINIIHNSNKKVALETQGSKWQDWMIKIDDLILSPKPPSSGIRTDHFILQQIINKLESNKKMVSLKIVVFDDEDFEYAKQLLTYYPNIPMYLSVGNSDIKSTNLSELRIKLLNRLEWLFKKVCEEPMMNNVRPLPQLHTLVWGNERGV